MGVERMGLALVLAAGLAGCGAENQAQTAGQIVKGGSDETGEYIVAANWWKAAPDHSDPAACPGGGRGRGGGRGGGSGQANTGPCWVWGEVSGAAADTPNRIIVAVWGDRDQVSGQGRPGGGNYVLEVDGNGDSSPDGLSGTPSSTRLTRSTSTPTIRTAPSTSSSAAVGSQAPTA